MYNYISEYVYITEYWYRQLHYLYTDYTGFAEYNCLEYLLLLLIWKCSVFASSLLLVYNGYSYKTITL